MRSGLRQSSYLEHLKEEPPKANIIYLWKVEIWINFSIHLYFLVFYGFPKLNENFFFLEVLFHSVSNVHGLFLIVVWVLLIFSSFPIFF